MNAPSEPVTRITKTERLCRYIEGLGQDKNFRPIGIRTCALSAATGVPTNSIQALLIPHVKSGRILVCKVTEPGAITQNEYRKGSGVAAPEHVPLNPKRAGIALRCEDIKFPNTNQPQPKVGQNACSSATELPLALPSLGAPAVAAPATPPPDTHAALKKEPAARKAAAGDVAAMPRLSIDQDGALQMGDADDPARWVFTPAQVMALGDFLEATQGLWRP